MPRISEKVQQALEESRLLVLGAHILMAAQYQSALQKGFSQLPGSVQRLHLVAMVLIQAVLALLMAFMPRHLLVDGGEAGRGVHGAVTSRTRWALLPFALAFGLSMLVTFEPVVGQKIGYATGAAVALVALAAWYGPGLLAATREEQAMSDVDERGGGEGTPMKTKIEHALIEARIVVPGAQAMLAFQLFATLTEPFQHLPKSSQYVHLISLGCLAISVILLMTPAAFHRTVEAGEATQRQYNVTSVCIVLSMLFLAPGTVGDLYVVVQKVTTSWRIGMGVSVVALLVVYGLWFGPVMFRGRRA